MSLHNSRKMVLIRSFTATDDRVIDFNYIAYLCKILIVYFVR